MTNATSKHEIRKAALAQRDALPEQNRSSDSMSLVDFAEDIAAYDGAIVSGFFPIRSEIDVRPLMGLLHDAGAQLCLPIVMDKETIIFRQYDMNAPLVKTGFGTMGPDETAPTVDPDILLIPLAAFDGQGNRIGYGAGYYDRAIAKLYHKGKKPRLIGVAFECQRVEHVPAQSHDVPLDAVLTENGFQEIACRK